MAVLFKAYVRPALILVLIVLVLEWFRFLFAPLVLESQGVVLDFPESVSTEKLAEKLQAEHLLRYPSYLTLFLWLHPKTEILRGEYYLKNRTSFYNLFKQLTTGTGLYQRRFSIIPGWSWQQLKHALFMTDGVDHQIESMTDGEVMVALSNQPISPEGQFYPDTYFYTKYSKDISLLRRAYQRMQLKFNAAWEKRDLMLDLKYPYDALVLASLVEKEGYLDKERPMIAGVIMNRLKKNMRLQIDATVIYGLGNQYTGKLHQSELTDKSPYNTYVIKGIPPTPIAIPSIASINAVMHPAKHDYIYYVAKGDGSHQFTTTFEKHHEAIQESHRLRGADNTVWVNHRLLQSHLQDFLMNELRKYDVKVDQLRRD